MLSSTSFLYKQWNRILWMSKDPKFALNLGDPTARRPLLTLSLFVLPKGLAVPIEQLATPAPCLLVCLPCPLQSILQGTQFAGGILAASPPLQQFGARDAVHPRHVAGVGGVSAHWTRRCSAAPKPFHNAASVKGMAA